MFLSDIRNAQDFILSGHKVRMRQTHIQVVTQKQLFFLNTPLNHIILPGRENHRKFETR